MLNKLLFKQIDNSPLIVFRIIFGLLIALESFGAIFTGWITRTLVEPEFTFNFIGFDFLQPLPGYGMYFYFAVMGFCGLLVMTGYKYKWSLGLFTILWTSVYLMQKASYNNHYYLLILICILMLLVPANRYFSIDAKQNLAIKSISMPRWCSLIIILQIWIVYTYASLAKIYPDWLDLSVAETLMKPKQNYPVIGQILQQKWLHAFISYTGIFFDLLIVPLLLWKPTRVLAFIASIIFHIFNSIVFQIGIFPYLSLAFTLFFFEPATIRNIFLKKKPLYTENEIIIPKYRTSLMVIGSIYFLVHISLPLRHWLIKDDVLWTEEGHRLSWRMMLRSKQGYISFKVVDKNSGQTSIVYPKDYLSKKQQRIIATKPDVIWQFVQRLKKNYNNEGKEVAIYINRSKVRVNNGELMPFIDPDVDLASEKWHPLKHHTWILPYKKE
ncbi:HTTM domain-containing protein [Abyssalbus ytuae]|uniref:HTTM domain-containing protein n=1 Tax=Abyssalbus ytuae TaxID=2926907 RepID=A0A9E7D0N2_9FLAO|nr:HTTM domain-containing protein [Abyssalbus ytuae]UOB16193.1 HTTM domain-containing protein [Abyssalbus ytuae]